MLVASVMSGVVIILFVIGIVGYSVNPTFIKSSAWAVGKATDPAESYLYLGLESFYTSTTDSGVTFTNVVEFTSSECSINPLFTPLYTPLVTLSEAQCSTCSSSGQISFALTLVATALVVLLLPLSIYRFATDSVDRKESSVFVSASACLFAVAAFASFQSTCLEALRQDAGKYSYSFGPSYVCLVAGSAALVVITLLHVIVPVKVTSEAVIVRKGARGYAQPGDVEVPSARTKGADWSPVVPGDEESPPPATVPLEPLATERSGTTSSMCTTPDVTPRLAQLDSTPERESKASEELDSSSIGGQSPKHFPLMESMRVTPESRSQSTTGGTPERQVSMRMLPGISPENLVLSAEDGELV